MKISTFFCKIKFWLIGDRCRSILAVSILTTRRETNATTELKQKRHWRLHDKYRIDVYYFEIKNKITALFSVCYFHLFH